MPVLSGPVVLGFSQEDPGAVARVFEDFVKENEDNLAMIFTPFYLYLLLFLLCYC
jgi:ribosomal protein L10